MTTDKGEDDRKPADSDSGAVVSPSPSLPTPTVRARSLSPRAPSSPFFRNEALPGVAHLYEGPPPSVTATPAAAAPLLFVCDECWRTFTDGSQLSCACERPRPVEGWAAMPYVLRGRFLFVELLGRGGMGAVFRAYDQASKDRPWVAVKVIQKGLPELEASLKEMFRREVAAAQMLAQHKQFFVDVLGFDDVAPAYLALEHVPWQTLAEVVASLPAIERRLPPAQVARIGIAILRGAAKMHFHRIVHRDLTPANIFVRHVPDREGYDVKITDLGLWAFDQVQGESDSLSLVGMPGTAGTAAYMSPEQSTGEKVGAASDLHAIGSVLWELATGSVPYPATTDGRVHEIIERRAKTLYEPPARPAFMPEGLYHVLVKALAFEAEARFSAANDMRKALEAFVASYQQERLRDLEDALVRIDGLARKVTSLRDKMTPMREVLERLSLLGAILREAQEQRGEAEPAVLRTIADNTETQLAQITREIGALAEWLRVLGEKKDVPPGAGEKSGRREIEVLAPREGRATSPKAKPRGEGRALLVWGIVALVVIVVGLFFLRAWG
ncbi:serine/threonine-protein kinase [Polyangium fumosum]|uniref:Serine/threonine protein kinase n=1 Tax=Polyangium fumosum TaxID=889272 RepID=A0A4U1J9G3_9BACT|nr:serine/threonine-protein kinase [Polyangium fumosum]TKD05040.1 serine/threonine protein kinase [Polyangium fumosum]